MKIFKFMAVALVAVLGLASCEKEHECAQCTHEFIEHDYSQELVGTWTCLELDYSEAMVIKSDGSVEVTGVVDGEYFESKGTIKVVNNKMIYKLDNGDEWEGRFEMTAGESFTMVWDDEFDIRYTYRYCENDLADEVVGMWVCNDGPTAAKGDMMVQTFKEDGSSIMTGRADEILVEDKSTTYKVVGDLIFLTMNKENVKHESFRITYSPNGTAFGDVMTLTLCCNFDIAPTTTWLRVKQGLNLTNRTYDYVSAYVTDAKGADEDFTILGNTFNISKITSNNLDMMFRSILSCIELNEHTFTYKIRLDDRESEMNDPITVEGNKVTLDMSATNPACRPVDIYMFQDLDDCQLHMYMHTDAFVNYFANLQIPTLVSEGELDTTNEAAVEKVFADMKARIESINVSLVYKARE